MQYVLNFMTSLKSKIQYIHILKRDMTKQVKMGVGHYSEIKSLRISVRIEEQQYLNLIYLPFLKKNTLSFSGNRKYSERLKPDKSLDHKKYICIKILCTEQFNKLFINMSGVLY